MRGEIMSELTTYKTVLFEKADGIGWATLNRPEKRNAMSPELHLEMSDLLSRIEVDPEVRVVVLAGAGDAWCAGMDLKTFFRDLEDKPAERARAEEAAYRWRWQRFFTFPKPTIAMVNGYCFGGGFTQLIACDFAIASDQAIFGLSEVNWGIIPGGIVSKALTECLSYRSGLYYAMTGDTFDAAEAVKIGLVNKAVPAEKLREETIALANKLLKINPEALRGTKQAMKMVRGMSMDQASDYLAAKFLEVRFRDREQGYVQGIRQFVDDKSYRPGFAPYARPKS
jgi:trans-feruloyl-CoA hydratase/vanillin synthase